MAVSGDNGSCYMEVEPGRAYAFELVGRGCGRWRSICRTGSVAMPAAPSARGGGCASEELAVRKPLGRDGVFRFAMGAAAVPGLRFESTPLHLSSSPRGVWSGGASGRIAVRRRAP